MDMADRDEYIPGVPCWVDTNQPDPEAALPFYGGLFGWEFEDAMPPGSGSNYFIGRIRGGDVAAIGSIPDSAPSTAALWNSYVCVASADETAEKVRQAGGAVTSGPIDVADAGRLAVIADPEGAELYLWQPKTRKGAQVVNEHGAVNFNGLNTRDRQAAEAFYGAVFGWQLLRLPAGWSWTLPGYGDHLEERTPGLRARMESFGAPEGFIDVVAALTPIADDDSTTPAHWDVTFGVDAADATAAKVVELGGEVVTGPFDAPWCRNVVVRDPQGATFIASQFVPENRELEA
jgi:predicted enzyme related to lactoylglutathione lyase